MHASPIGRVRNIGPAGFPRKADRDYGSVISGRRRLSRIARLGRAAVPGRESRDQPAAGGQHGGARDQGGDACPVDAPGRLEDLDHHRPGGGVTQGHPGEAGDKTHRPVFDGVGRQDLPAEAPRTLRMAASLARARARAAIAPASTSRPARPATAAAPRIARARRSKRSAAACERLAHADDADGWELAPRARVARRFLGRRGAGDGDMAQVRPGQRGRVEDQREVWPEAGEVDLAQGGDAGVDLATQHVQRDGVADLQVRALGRVDRDGDEWRPGVVRGPPAALDDPRVSAPARGPRGKCRRRRPTDLRRRCGRDPPGSHARRRSDRRRTARADRFPA